MRNENRQEGTLTDGGTEVFDPLFTDMSKTEQAENKAVAEVSSETQREFLLEAIRRAPILVSLQQESVAASELSNKVDMSRSTIHRAVKSLDEYDIIEESGGTYELTSLGEILAREIQMFGTRANIAHSLRDFLNPVEVNSERIPLEHFGDAKTTRRTSRQPHATIHRIIKLIEDAESPKMFSTVISPVYVGVGYRKMMDGMKIEAIFDREVIDIMALEYPEKAYESVSTGNFDLYAHDGLPFELLIFEDKIGLAAHNENGNAEILIECEDTSAIEWAENVYSEHLSDADSINTANFE
jgi:predicted transcriptional regulator